MMTLDQLRWCLRQGNCSAVDTACVPEMVRYTLRHYMNTRAMRAPAHIRPHREERAAWMGHEDPNHSQTQHYERFDPEFLERCKFATDFILSELNELTARSLFAPGADHLVTEMEKGGERAS